MEGRRKGGGADLIYSTVSVIKNLKLKATLKIYSFPVKKIHFFFFVFLVNIKKILTVLRGIL